MRISRSRALLSILPLLYVFFLPFSSVGFPVALYGITLSDFTAGLALLAIMATGGLRQLFRPVPEFRGWLVGIGLFALTLLPSAFQAKNLLRVGVELLPFLHAGFITFLLAWFIMSQGHEGIPRLRSAYQLALVIAMIPIVSTLFIPPGPSFWEFFGYSSGKYQFFLRTPNQLSVFALTGLALGMACGAPAVPRDPLLFIIAGFGIFHSGSRAGALVYFLLTAGFLALLLERCRTGRLPWLRFFFSVLVLGAFCSLMIAWPEGYATRSISVIQNVRRGEMGDAFRIAQFRAASELFLQNPIVGIGLGNYLPLSPSGHEIHNSFKSLLVETGCVGFLGFLALQAFLFSSVLRSPRSWDEKAGALLALTAFLLCMHAHHILRERWLWLAYLMIVGRFRCSAARI